MRVLVGMIKDENDWLIRVFGCSASSLGMMNEEEKKMQRIEDIKELLS